MTTENKNDTTTKRKRKATPSGGGENELTQTLLDEIEKLRKKVEEIQSGSVSEEKKEDETTEKLSSDDYITVMSLIPWRLNLSTGKVGERPYSFERLYETKRILYSRLVDIIDYQWSFVEKGLFYILDRRVVREHGLDDVYEKILDKEKIESVLKKGKETAYPIFATANERQKKNIAQIIINMLVSGEVVDQNMVLAVSSDTGIDINEKVKDTIALTKNSNT